MKYHRQPSAISYKKGVDNFIKKIKEKNLKIEFYSFGSSIDTINDISFLSLDANSTNLGLVSNKFNQNYKKDIAGVIIFNDDQLNQGLQFQELNKNLLEFPLHIVGIGETTPMLDVSAKSISLLLWQL